MTSIAESTRQFELHTETSKLLDIVESSNDDSHRHDAILALGTSGKPEASRVLLEAFDKCMWRTTKLKIIQALAQTREPRALIFLMRLACNPSDLTFAAEAVLALGETG